MKKKTYSFYIHICFTALSQLIVPEVNLLNNNKKKCFSVELPNFFGELTQAQTFYFECYHRKPFGFTVARLTLRALQCQLSPSAQAHCSLPNTAVLRGLGAPAASEQTFIYLFVCLFVFLNHNTDQEIWEVLRTAASDLHLL